MCPNSFLFLLGVAESWVQSLPPSRLPQLPGFARHTSATFCRLFDSLSNDPSALRPFASSLPFSLPSSTFTAGDPPLQASSLGSSAAVVEQNSKTFGEKAEEKEKFEPVLQDFGVSSDRERGFDPDGRVVNAGPIGIRVTALQARRHLFLHLVTIW